MKITNKLNILSAICRILLGVTLSLPAMARTLPIGETSHELGNTVSNDAICVMGTPKSTPINEVKYSISIDQTYSREKDITFYTVQVGVSLVTEIVHLTNTRRTQFDNYDRVCAEYVTAKMMSVQSLITGRGYYYGPRRDAVPHYTFSATPQNFEMLKLIVKDFEENVLKDLIPFTEVKSFGQIEGANIWPVQSNSSRYEDLQKVAQILEIQKSKAIPGPVFQTSKYTKN